MNASARDEEISEIIAVGSGDQLYGYHSDEDGDEDEHHCDILFDFKMSNHNELSCFVFSLYELSFINQYFLIIS